MLMFSLLNFFILNGAEKTQQNCSQGCACFSDFLQNYSECQIFCLVVFHALTLKLPIKTSISVALKLQVCVRLCEKCHIFRKTSTPLGAYWVLAYGI